MKERMVVLHQVSQLDFQGAKQQKLSVEDHKGVFASLNAYLSMKNFVEISESAKEVEEDVDEAY
jgi:hypothetical protein